MLPMLTFRFLQVEFHRTDERDAEPSGAGGKCWQAVGHRRLRWRQQPLHGRMLRPREQQVDFCGTHVRARGRCRGGRGAHGVGGAAPTLGVHAH
jgi:hypothetical protein